MFGIGWKQTVSEAEAKAIYEAAVKNMGDATRDELVAIHRRVRRAHKGAFNPNGGPQSSLQCRMAYLLSDIRQDMRTR